MSEIRFMYDIQGQPATWLVIKQYGRGWLCEVVDGPQRGRRAEFAAETIRFGQMRLKESAAGELVLR